MELYRSTCIVVLGQFANCDGQIQRFLYQTKTKRLVISSVAMMSLNLQRERQMDPSFKFLLNGKEGWVVGGAG